MTKQEIVRQLGQEALLIPALLDDALAANERLKLRLTMLQQAAAHAQAPGEISADLAPELRAAGLSERQFDETITGARWLDGDRLAIPGATALIDGVTPDLQAMLAPLKAADAPDCAAFERRFDSLAAKLPAATGDELSIREISDLSAARRGGADSVHLLVMDLHHALNRLVAETAVEMIDGAKVHHIAPEDRDHVAAFMRGVNRTQGLAFGHPGLGTTVTRSGPRLILQNDVGMTDAHVLVIQVEQQAVTVTYTDVHRVRAHFFMSLFDRTGVVWSDLSERQVKGLARNGAFYLVSGRFEAATRAALDDFLTRLGSRVVFLIDWNKARKALQNFVPEKDAIEILRGAAEQEFGHRAFLELGGTALVYEVIRRAAAGRIPYGQRLDAALGVSETVHFLTRILALTSKSLANGRSIRLIRDEIQADLAQLFESAEFVVLSVLLRHLGVAHMLASTICQATEGGALTPERANDLVITSKRLESKADQLTLEAREICARVQHGGTLRQAIDEAEDATDALDEAAFLLSLTASAAAAPPVPLAALARLTVDALAQLVRATEAALRLPEGDRADAEDALAAIDGVLFAEHEADTAQRDIVRALAGADALDAKNLVFLMEATRALETATDHLAHAAFSLRDRVLEELSA